MWFNIIVVMIGVFLHLYSLLLCGKIIKALPKKTWLIPWYLLISMIIFFITGYLGYICKLFLWESIPALTTNYLISVIFLFGAIFVIVILNISLYYLKSLMLLNKKISSDNIALKDYYNTLKEKTDQLKKTKNNLLNENRDLEDTLEDFYTLRISMERHLKLDQHKIEKENDNIKNKLSKIKK